MSRFARCVTGLFFLWWTEVHALEILAPAELQRAFNKATDFQATYYEDTFVAARAAIAATKAHIFIASNENTWEMARQMGLVSGEGKPFFYKRLAIAVQLKNPKLIFDLDDLSRPNIRLVVCPKEESLLGDLTAKILAGLKIRPTLFARSPEEMINLLVQHKADAALCWDTLEVLALGKICIMRLPWRICPTQICYAAVTRFGLGDSAAANLLDSFTSGTQRNRLFQLGFWMDSGKDGGAHMDRIATTIFAPMYPLLAKQIVDDYKITEGVCVDIGCGPGQLPIELAKITRLKIYGLDIEPQALELARRHAKESGIGHERLRFVSGDALCLPFPDNFADLVVSRGTVPFLRDKAQGFREAYRILKPGGVAFMGGGFSRYQSPESVALMREASGENKPGGRAGAMKMDFPPILKEAGITNYRLIRDNGLWVEMKK